MAINKMKASISFKSNEQEMWDFLNSKLSISIYLKELIQRDMEQNKKQEKLVSDQKRSSSISLEF